MICAAQDDSFASVLQACTKALEEQIIRVRELRGAFGGDNGLDSTLRAEVRTGFIPLSHVMWTFEKRWEIA